MTDEELLAILKDYCGTYRGLAGVYKKVEELIAENAKLKEKPDASVEVMEAVEQVVEKQVVEELIPGVEIVSKTELFNTVTNDKNTLMKEAIHYFAFILLVIGVVAIICNSMILIALVSITLFLLLVMSMIIEHKEKLFDPNVITKVGTGEFEYEVKVSDTVSFNEFNRRFEFIWYDGELYTIREKK